MTKLLTIKQVQEITGLCRNTIVAHIKRGLLPAAKLGQQWRVRPEDLEKYVRGEK